VDRSWLLLGIGSSLAACAEEAPAPVLADCVGDYVGDYDGAEIGEIRASLSSDGALTATFTSGADEVAAAAVVAADGEVSGEAGPIEVSGVFEFEVCAAAGSWSAYGQPAGSWGVARESRAEP
jgi:hypothetical protein